MAVHGAQHPLFRLLLEPAVDVVGQKRGVLLQHPVIILVGDVQIGADLPVGRLADVQRLDPVHAVIHHAEHGLAEVGVHHHIAGEDAVVGLGPLLTLQLNEYLLDGASAFHVDTPFRCYQLTRSAVSWMSAASPSWASTLTSVGQ